MKIEFEKAFEDETSRNENLPILNNHVFKYIHCWKICVNV